jgi:photosystem II stability/assembly factor-like uncharacterized protein
MTAETLRIYAATHEGVVVSQLKDGTCETLSSAFAGSIVDCVQPRPATPGWVFAAVTHDGLHRTKDGGKTWTRVLGGDMRAVAVDPSDDRVIYAGTGPVRLYRSEDAGDTWKEIESIQRLPDDTRKMLGLPPTTADEMKRFRKGRQEWSFPIPPHEGHITEIFIRRENPNEIWLSMEHGGVALSRDRGKTWTDASAGIDYLDIHKLLRLPVGQDRYLVSSARGLYASSDPVQGWERAETGCARDYFHEMLVLPAAAGATPPVLVCTADGSPVRWPATKGDGKWLAGVTGARAALYRSDDAGGSWRRVGVGPDLPEEMDPMIWSLARDPRDANGVFAGTGEVARGYAFGTGGKGAILYSPDQGANWRAVKTDLRAVRQICVTGE